MERCEIIAEIGINHNGDMAIAKTLIKGCAHIGVDVVKFQLYDPDKLLNRQDFSYRDWEAIKQSQLSYEKAKELKEECDRAGVEFMASAFDKERLEWLESLGVKRHKLASRSLADTSYCLEVFKTGKEIFISDGWFQAKKLCSWPAGVDAPWERLKWMYCISEYPAPLHKINFVEYGGPVFGLYWSYYYWGFSDHTIGTNAAKIAMALGAKAIEKHVTFSRKAPGPDHFCSITLAELRDLCAFRTDLMEVMKEKKKKNENVGG